MEELYLWLPKKKEKRLIVSFLDEKELIPHWEQMQLIH